MITEAILKAFLQCPLKAHYLISGRTPPKNEYAEFDEQIERIHVDKARLALPSIFAPDASSAVPLVHEDLSTRPDALERVAKRTMVVPIRIFPRARISDLERRRLRKHKASVEEFLDDLAVREYRSEVAEKCRTRIVKSGEKLFTFLDHDGVPWNNNGAENAIKDFAMLRRAIGGVSTESGMGDYLVLLSIRQTLKRRGVGFLDFLVSGRKDLERFALQ